eukprot:COSAG01_NODE_10941_length_2043_cov_1.408436_4_plen_57_part_01
MPIRVRVEMMGSQTCGIVGKAQAALTLIEPMIMGSKKCRIVGKSQPALTVIEPMIFT